MKELELGAKQLYTSEFHAKARGTRTAGLRKESNCRLPFASFAPWREIPDSESGSYFEPNSKEVGAVQPYGEIEYRPQMAQGLAVRISYQRKTDDNQMDAQSSAAVYPKDEILTAS